MLDDQTRLECNTGGGRSPRRGRSITSPVSNTKRAVVSVSRGQRYTRAIASMSWIDPRAAMSIGPLKIQLPEHDPGPPINSAPVATRDFVVSADVCRFAHLLSATIVVRDGEIVEAFTEPESAIYRRPSHKDLDSLVYPMNPAGVFARRHYPPADTLLEGYSPKILGDRVVFAQCVGCRTDSPRVEANQWGDRLEEALFGKGASTGFSAAVGGAVADEFIAFPPIWTVLELTIRNDGWHWGRLLSSSSFPSVSTYLSVAPTQDAPNYRDFSLISSYDGVPSYEQWNRTGWSSGNPWGVADPGKGGWKPIGGH